MRTENILHDKAIVIVIIILPFPKTCMHRERFLIAERNEILYES